MPFLRRIALKKFCKITFHLMKSLDLTPFLTSLPFCRLKWYYHPRHVLSLARRQFSNSFYFAVLQGIFITKILPDGPAKGILEPGDKLLKVSTKYINIL